MEGAVAGWLAGREVRMMRIPFMEWARVSDRGLLDSIYAVLLANLYYDRTRYPGENRGSVQ